MDKGRSYEEASVEQDRCPNCGKFVEIDADGFYDREWPYWDGASVVQYCNESCCDEKRAKDDRILGGR